MSHIKVNMDKAKVIAHTARRLKRDVDMKPLDIQATIPAMSVKAEADRQLIRDVDSVVQVDIDNCSDDVALKAVMVAKGLID